MKEQEKMIAEALTKNVDLTESEYRKLCENADKSTKAHGVSGRAALTESTRHKRIQTNFYGTCINILLSALAELSQTNAILLEMLKKQQEKGG